MVWVSLVGVLAFTVIAVSVIGNESDKMPITTSSDKALDYYLQGRKLAERLRGNEAIGLFQKAIEADSKFALAHFGLARVQTSAKLFFESLDKAKSLVDSASEAEKMLIMGFTEVALNAEPMKQREIYKQLVEAYPRDERARYLLAVNYYAQQEWKPAIEEFERAAEVNPEYAPLYNELGYAQRFSGDYTGAEKSFRKYIELIPDDPNPYDSYAELLMRIGKYDESIEQYRAALTIKPDFSFSHLGIASNLNFKGQHEQAREQLKIMYDEAKTNPLRRTAIGGIANSFLDEQKFDDAIAQYDIRYEMDMKLNDTSQMARSLILRAFILIEVQGRANEALDNFEEAMKLSESSSIPESAKNNIRRNHLFNLGRTYLAMGDLEKAKANAAEFRKRVEAKSSAFQIKRAFHLDGLIALADGSYDTAIEDFKQSNMQNPYNLYHLAKAYDGKGNAAKAKEYYAMTANFNGLNSALLASVRAKAAHRVADML